MEECRKMKSELKGKPYQVFLLTPKVWCVILAGVAASLLAVGVQVLLGKTFDYVLARQSSGGFPVSYFGLLFFLTLLSLVASTVCIDYLPIWVNLERAADVQCHVMRRMLDMPLQPWQTKDEGYLFNVLTSTSFTMGDLYYHISVELISCGVSFLVMLAVAWWLSPLLTYAILAYIPVAVLVVLGPTKAIAAVQARSFPLNDACRRVEKTIIDRKKVITIAGAQDSFYKRGLEAVLKYLKFIKLYQFIRVVEANLVPAMSALFQLVLLALSVGLYMQGKMTMGSVLVAWQLGALVQQPLAQCINNVAHYRVNRPYIDRMKEFCDLADRPTGFEGLYGPQEGLATIEEGRFYPTSAKDRLLFATEKRLDLPAKGLVLFKGANGSGKSMLLNFLTAYGDAAAFEGKAGLNPMLKNVAYLTYPLLLMKGSFEDNLFGKGYDPEVARMLDIDFFDKQIDDEKVNLSFGEGQKLNLLRVLSNPSPVVVLDEPFTNLDKETAARLSAYLGELKRHKALLAVVHGPQLDEAADRIYRITDGALVQEK